MRAGRAMALMLALLPMPVAAETVAIVNGQIHSLSPRGVIEKGTVLIRDDRIVAVGDNVAVPPDARIVEMDSLIGRIGGKVLLTLMSRDCGPMLAFLRDRND